MNDDSGMFRAVIRDTFENHINTPPRCDPTCARWDGTAHAHICPDGLNNDDLPWIDITAWCSCGIRLGGPVRLDVRRAAIDVANDANASGEAFVSAFRSHMRLAHGIDIETDEAWLDKLATPPTL
jgi:hypothetical protein